MRRFNPSMLTEAVWNAGSVDSSSSSYQCFSAAFMHQGNEQCKHEWMSHAVGFIWLGFLVYFCNRPAINQELSNLFNELWRLDVNRMKPGIDYTISVQVRSCFPPTTLCTLLKKIKASIGSVSRLCRAERDLWTRAAMLWWITPRCLFSPTLTRANWATQPPSPVSVG